MSTEIILTAVILSAAYFFDGIFGFGAGLISLPFLTELYPFKFAVTLLLLVQGFMAFATFASRKDIDWELVKVAGPFTLLGGLIGTFLLAGMDDYVLRYALGVLIVVYLIREYFSDSAKKSLREMKWLGAVGGGLGGILQGAFSLGGPGFIIYLNECNLKGANFRATMLCLFFLCNCVRAVASFGAGLITAEVVSLFLKVGLFVAFAIYLGAKVHVSVPTNWYRRVVYLVLGVSAFNFLRPLLS